MAVSMMFVMSASHATTYGFNSIFNYGLEDLSAQLAVDVTAGNYDWDLDGNTEAGAFFTFTNDVVEGSADPLDDYGFSSNIAAIYFDNTSNLFVDSSFVIESSSSEVNFGSGNSPSFLPGTNGAGSTFTTTDTESANNPAPQNGVNSANDYIIFFAAFSSGSYDISQFLTDFSESDFQIGLHVTSIGATEFSDSYVSPPNVVPVPAAAWLFGTALFGFAAARRKNNS